MGATVVVFAQVVGFEFLTYDDSAYVTQNARFAMPEIREFCRILAFQRKD